MGSLEEKKKYTVARSESTTLIGVIPYYKNQATSQTPPITAGPGTTKGKNHKQTSDNAMGMRGTGPATSLE